MTPFKGRAIDGRQQAEVYRNLNMACFSVRQNGLVIGHTKRIALRDATYCVRSSGREKVRREGRKNVHAFIKGTVVDDRLFSQMVSGGGLTRRVTYDPYKYDTFVDCFQYREVKESDLCLLEINNRSKITAFWHD